MAGDAATQQVQDTLGNLRRFEDRAGPDGLILRYCRGRVGSFAARQILTLMGAVALAWLETPMIGLLALGLGLVGDSLDCKLLGQVLRDFPIPPVPPRQRALILLSGTLQGATIAACVGLAWLSSGSQAAEFFATAFLIGAAINAGLIRPYFARVADARLLVFALTWAGLVLHDLLLAHSPAIWLHEHAYYLLATLILAYMTGSFLSYVSRSFSRNTRIEHDLLRQSHALRLSGEALRAREAQANRLAAVARNANDSVILCTPDGRIDWVNDTFTRLTGYAMDEVLGKRPSDVLNAPESDAETIARIETARAAFLPCRAEIQNRTKDGRLIWMETSITPLIGPDGQHSLTINVERDITDAKDRARDLAEARKRAEAAAEAKSRFLATMSHEIRTPMTGVIGMAELLAETRLDAIQQGYVGTIIESGQALLTLINDILDLSRLQAGRMQTEARPFDVTAVIGSVVMLLGPLARAKGLSLAGLPAAVPPLTMLGDSGRVRQILINLIGNAIKFTRQGGIAVHLAEGDGQARISVTDTGIGIAAPRLEMIFESFTQADGTINREFGGTGLGLTVSRLLAHEMRGDVTVRSAPEEGSTFTLHLPLVRALTEPVRAPVAAPPDPVRLGGLRVLVAEDNRTNRLILRKMLDGCGVIMLEAANGAEALRLVQEQAPDLVLMDMQMPVMDGLSAIRAIRAAEGQDHPPVPIIVLTANAFAEDQTACRLAGADDFLGKPVSRGELIACMSGTLARHRRAFALPDPPLLPENRHRGFDPEVTLRVSPGI